MIKVSCHKYKGWEKNWPEAKKRLDMLLGFINPDKPILSVNYSVTNSFKARKSDAVLNPSTLFQSPNIFIAKQILQLADPRWDFDQGWFDAPPAPPETLVRIKGGSRIEGDWVIATIESLHACHLGCSVRTLLESSGGSSRMDEDFDDFHNRGKKLLGHLLVPDLADRMGLDAA